MTYAYQINQSMICWQLVEYANIGRISCAMYCQDRWLFLSRYHVVATERCIRFLFIVYIVASCPFDDEPTLYAKRIVWLRIVTLILKSACGSSSTISTNGLRWKFLSQCLLLAFFKVRFSFWIRKPVLLASAIGDEVGPWIFQSRGTIWLLQNNGWIL